jgi:hypothetical protein
MKKIDWTSFKQTTIPALEALENTPTSKGLMVARYHVLESAVGGNGYRLLRRGFPTLESAVAYVETFGTVHFAERDKRCVDIVVGASGRVVSIVPLLPASLGG